MNYLGEMGYTSAQIAIEALQRAGRDLTVDSLVKAMESIQDFHDLFGGTYTFSPTNHHGATARVPVGGAQRPLGAGGGSRAGVLSGGMTKSPIRIAVLHFSHETVTFLQQRHDDRRLHLSRLAGARRGAAGSGPNSYMGGFVQVAARVSTASSWSASNRRCGRRPAPAPAG